MIKRWGIVLMALAVLVGSTVFSPPAEAAAVRYGLTVRDGVIYMNDKPFYGYGTNLFTTYNNHITMPLNERFKEDFAIVKKYGIPFVRIAFSGYQADYYDQFDKDPEMLFALMDDIVREAEKQRLGIIADLLWWDPAIPAHVGEKRADMGNPNSKTVVYAKKYAAAVVKRYVNSPAIWGWEIGNEYNLTADLCGPTLTEWLWPNGIATMPIVKSGYNYYTSMEARVFLTEIAKEIRKHDPYRLISSGNGDTRSSARNMQKMAMKMDKNTHTWGLDWKDDSLDDFHYMNAYMTPDPIDTMCMHLQHGTLDVDPPSLMLDLPRWGRKVPSLEYFKEYVNSAKKAKKALYFGEIGDFLDMDLQRPAEVPDKYNQIMDWVVEAGVQLASTWQFTTSPTNLVASEEPLEKVKLTKLKNINAAFQKQGKQDLSKAWTDVGKTTTKPTDTSKEPPVTTTTKGKTTTTRATTTGGGSSVPTTGSATVSGIGEEVASYMVSAHTAVTIDVGGNAIRLEQPMTFDLFTRSIRLRDGYAMEVLDADQQPISEADVSVGEGCVAIVSGPDGAERRRFTVTVEAAGNASSEPSSALHAGGEPTGMPGWGVALLVIGLVLVIGGGGAGLYFGVIRKRLAGRDAHSEP